MSRSSAPNRPLVGRPPSSGQETGPRTASRAKPPAHAPASSTFRLHSQTSVCARCPTESRARRAAGKRRRETHRRPEAGIAGRIPGTIAQFGDPCCRRQEGRPGPRNPRPCAWTRAKVGMHIEVGFVRPWPCPRGRWRNRPLRHLNEAGRGLRRNVALQCLHCRGRVFRADRGGSRRS